MPSKKDIAEYWKNNMPYNEMELNFDWADAEFCCWNCGEDKRRKERANRYDLARLERCHIQPKQFKGSNDPSNFVLLCKQCHSQAPNYNSLNASKYFWEWIKSNKVMFPLSNSYNFSKGLEMFEYVREVDFLYFIQEHNIDFSLIQQKIKNIGTHGATFNPSTYFAMFCDIYDNHVKTI